ncbi:MAG: 3'-5' exonuclease, partial [Anaerolineales bacterium]|nr:3'-5' exonuclease [Anaerolineales bacterium]
MPETLISLDLETTGLDPDNDVIIEIGAVKFSNERVDDEFHTLVNPGRPISRFITQLTGITNEMVAEKPLLAAVLPRLTDFVGTTPLLAHNVGFDLGFLRKHGALQMNAQVDTMDLAATVLPAAGRYSLGALATELEVALPATHRALDDARVTRAVYLALLKRARELPRHALAELVRHGSALRWGANLPLQELLQA